MQATQRHIDVKLFTNARAFSPQNQFLFIKLMISFVVFMTLIINTGP